MAGSAEDDDFNAINNWRSIHSFPLNTFTVNLRNRARRVHKQAVVAQRLKRMSSIRAKLNRFPEMKLTQMQDIGGCRAVVRDGNDVYRLFSLYLAAMAKNPNRGPEYVEEYDYIASPKDDGYRGIHLVYKYRTKSEDHKPLEGLRIEIQLRSHSQHIWATAVETVSTFTGQALKFSGGRAEWRRFFVLTSAALAAEEGTAIPSHVPTDREKLIAELQQLRQDLAADNTLRGWGTAVKQLTEKAPPNSSLFLLVLDPREPLLKITPYTRGYEDRAAEHYLRVEREIGSDELQQAVLVSVESVKALAAAYPNYFLDTTDFLGALKRLTSKTPHS